jgi:hypothetical protein
VDATIVQVQTRPVRRRFTTIWKYCGQPQFQNTTKEVLYFVIVLLNYQIADVESIDSPNNGQHEIFGFRFVASAFEENDLAIRSIS